MDADLEALSARVRRAFRGAFDAEPVAVFRAPGRVNLIGEHTDYNDGFVLPCAIDYCTLAAVSPRADHRVHVVAADHGDALDAFDLTGPIPTSADAPWSNYVRGVASVLGERGEVLTGLDIAIAGNVPQGAGLSSSAALEVVVGEAFRHYSGLRFDNAALARIAQAAENDFVGCKCGIMDQMASASGAAGRAMLLDCRSLAIVRVPMPDELAVLIVNSNVRRGLLDSEYNTRRAQCEAAAAGLGVAALRDITLAELVDRKDDLDPVVYRRARHIVSENERTLDAAAALARADAAALSRLMAASHASMRDDFEITVEPIDLLVSLLADVIGEAGGARMTGGGFGGCVVALLPRERVAEAKGAIARRYEAATGLRENVYVCAASEGSGPLHL